MFNMVKQPCFQLEFSVLKKPGKKKNFFPEWKNGWDFKIFLFFTVKNEGFLHLFTRMKNLCVSTRVFLIYNERTGVKLLSFLQLLQHFLMPILKHC